MGFEGWPAEAIEFFEGLEADNSKAYWSANKAVYEESVRGPMAALLDELAAEFGEGRIFRPYRDVRFSRDKAPYKTSIAATLAGGGYIQLSTDGLGAGNGMYAMAPDQLERYRSAVGHDLYGVALESAIKKVEKDGITVSGHGTLKTAPRGYPKDHPRITLLRNKGLVTWKQWDVGPWLGTAQVRAGVARFLRASRPVSEWLDANVGPTTMETRR
jgi:uncharacterized protein (TIGR02453 family)